MEFKSLVMSLGPHDILKAALLTHLVSHDDDDSHFRSFLRQLNESPDKLLENHSLASIDTKDQLLSKQKKSRNGCVIM